MRVVCLLFAVACIQAVSLEAKEQGGFGSAFSFIKQLFGGSTKKISNNYWPYKQVHSKQPRQSPVDLVTSLAVTRPLPTLEIIEPNMRNHVARFYNSGHTVYVYMDEDKPADRPKLKGGPLLGNTFYFEQMHFHWGGEDVWGSEHLLNGESFSAEVHMVHWNSKYDNFTYAASQPDGLAVLTIFVEKNDAEDNPLMEPLYKMLTNVSQASTSVNLDTYEAMKWAISTLSDNTEYYAYPGSLTTEPYSENVIFILLPTPIYLSTSQLHAFRQIHGSEGHGFITDNKRQLQPLHGRPIVRATSIREYTV